MAILFETDFTGGPVGTTASITTEPIFTHVQGIGVATYRDVPGVGQGVEFPSANGAAWSIESFTHTVWRIGWKCTFLGSTATSTYHFMMLTRFGGVTGTIGWDVGLRNATGARQASARNNFSYMGEAVGNPMAINETWSFEALCDNGALTVSVWDGINTDGAATYVWTGTYALTQIDSIQFGNAAGASNVGMILSDFFITDGPRRGPDAPVLNYSNNGWARDTSFSVQLSESGSSTAKLRYTTDPAMVSGSIVNGVPKGDGYWECTPVGLLPDTVYYWRAELNGVVAGVIGQTKTLPADNNLTLGWGSCHWEGAPSNVFDSIVARDLDTFINLGDDGYTWISTGPNGSFSPTDPIVIRELRQPLFSTAGRAALTRKIPIENSYSDRDSGANDGEEGGMVGGVFQDTFRQMYAVAPTYPVAGCHARSFVSGMIRIIITDEISLATQRDVTDDSAKTKLGTAQKMWFKDEIQAAATAGEVVFWFGDSYYATSTTTAAGNNTWGKYNTERTELGAYITGLDMADRLIRFCGDFHTLILDDGTNNAWGGFPVACAAPMQETANAYGGNATGGKWPTVQTAASRQYGVCTVTATANALTVLVQGFSATTSEPTEIERYNQTFVFPIGSGPEPIPGAASFDTNYLERAYLLATVPSASANMSLNDLRALSGSVYTPRSYYIEQLSLPSNAPLSRDDARRLFFLQELT